MRDSGIVFAVTLLLLAAPAWRARPQEQESPQAATGRQLVTLLGCPGCHTITDPAFADLGKSGPDLRRIAAKTNPSWTLQWVTDPRKLRPTTWMPHFFDETDRTQAHAVVAYLWDKSQPVDYPSPPAGDAERGEELFHSVGCTGCHLRETGAERHDFPEPYRLQGPNLIHLGSKVDAAWLFAWLRNPRRYAPETRMPDLRLSGREAADLVAFLMASRAPDKEGAELALGGAGDVEAGREAIALYGCYGCHAIAGFEEAGRPAGEWTSLDGFSGHGLDGLPDFRLSVRELEAIRTATGKASAAGDAALVAGRRLVARYGCRGCHLLEGGGHAIEATIDDPGLLPPNLNGEGSRVQPAWLRAYLKDPAGVRLRSWLTVRMPTFDFSEEEIRTAVAYFAALEEGEVALSPAAAPTARSLALGREAFDLMPCGRCHPKGSAADALALGAASLGPPLGLASRRLRYEWIALWLKDPQSWLPGTMMPTFFIESRPGVFVSPFTGALDAPLFAEPKARMMELVGSEKELEAFLDDADAVIAALRDYVWSLGDE